MSKPRSRASTRDDTTTVSTGSKSKADAASAAEASDSSDEDEEEEPDVLVDVFKLDSYQERPRMNLPTQEVSVPPGQPRKVEAPIDPKGFKEVLHIVQLPSGAFGLGCCPRACFPVVASSDANLPVTPTAKKEKGGGKGEKEEGKMEEAPSAQ